MKLIIGLVFFYLIYTPANAQAVMKPEVQTNLSKWKLEPFNSELDLLYSSGTFQMGEGFDGSLSSTQADFLFGLKVAPWSYGLFLGYGLEKLTPEKKNYDYIEGSQTKERAGVYTKYEISPSFYLLGKWTIYQELNLKKFNFEEYFYDFDNNLDHTESLSRKVKFRGKEYELGGGYRFSRLFSASFSYFRTTYSLKSSIRNENSSEIQDMFTITNNVPMTMSASGIKFCLSILVF